jgi:hypothetical protein
MSVQVPRKDKVIAVGYENINLKDYDGPPYSYSVKVNGKLKRMMGFDEEHIKVQLHPKKATMIRKIKDV